MKKTFLLLLSILICNSTLLSQAKPIWQQWIKNNSYELSISDTINFQDLDFLKQVLKDKRVVFLGENSHGVSEFTLLKSRLIRYLHDELGFNVLVFESNAGDAFAANLRIPYTSGLNSIYNSISSMWHVEEIVPLFNYIRKTHNTKNPLNVAGVDITMSNGSYSFSNFLYGLIYPIDQSYAREIQKSDSIFSRIGVQGWTGLLSNEEKTIFKTMRNNQISVYSNCINFINNNEVKFPKNGSYYLEAAKFYLQSRIEFCYWHNSDSVYMTNKLQIKNSHMNLNKLYSDFRDSMLSQNLKFLTKTLYPEEKIIVWAHNAHITKWKYRMPADPSLSKLSYSIGLLSYSGKGCSTFGQAFDGSNPDSMIYNFKTPTDRLSVENILHSSNYDNTFVDMLHQTKCKGNSWMFKTSKWTAWDGKTLDEERNMRKYVSDGFILVNKISPPKYLRYDYDYLNKK